MFTYVCLGTNDLRRAARFYDATFGALGLERCNTGDVDWDKTSVGWGTYKDGGAREVALANAGSSEGVPGLRPYAADFHAAFVRDPDGNKLAVVCRGFTSPQ